MVGVKQPRPIQLAVPAKPLTLAMVGIGGYGDVYMQSLLSAEAARRSVRLVSAVDPFASGSTRLGELADRHVPIFSSLDQLFAGSDSAPDLVVLASPISLHAEQTIRALENGSHVLCEKPLSATVAQACQMMKARDRAGRTVSIGYQWSFSDPIQHLKRDIRSGKFGKARRLRTLVLWPRDQRYYTRNSWAGRRHDPATGAEVFDSPVNNACAHFLHNMLYVLGDEVDRSATPHGVTAELYRANAIDNYDTAAIRCMTSSGAELLFYVSHAVQETAGPILHYEFENAVIRCEGDEGALVAQLNDGTIVNYGVPASPVDMTKLWRTIDAIEANTRVECGIEAAMAQTQVMCAAQRSPQEIIDFPRELLRVESSEGSPRLFVEGLGEALGTCFKRGQLPSELDFEWARPAVEMSIYEC